MDCWTHGRRRQNTLKFISLCSVCHGHLPLQSTIGIILDHAINTDLWKCQVWRDKHLILLLGGRRSLISKPAQALRVKKNEIQEKLNLPKATMQRMFLGKKEQLQFSIMVPSYHTDVEVTCFGHSQHSEDSGPSFFPLPQVLQCPLSSDPFSKFQ